MLALLCTRGNTHFRDSARFRSLVQKGLILRRCTLETGQIVGGDFLGRQAVAAELQEGVDTDQPVIAVCLAELVWQV